MLFRLILSGLLNICPAAEAAPAFSSDSSFFNELGGIRSALEALDSEAPFAVPRATSTVDPLQMVLDNLQGSNVPAKYVKTAFASPTVQIHEEIVDLINKPAESLPYSEYRKIFITESRIRKGADFFRNNSPLIQTVTGAYKVDSLVLVGLLGVETYYGAGTGKYRVFNALYTICSRVPRRAKWAARELAELLRFSYSDKTDPHGIYGSYAGAFGYGQFMPSSFNQYAVDFDKDGKRDPKGWPDTLASVSNYLLKHGYEPEGTDFSEGSKIWKAIYGYNHSDNYVKVILELRSEIRKALEPGTRPAFVVP